MKNPRAALLTLLLLLLCTCSALADDGIPAGLTGTACNMSGEALTVYAAADASSQSLGAVSGNGYITVNQVRWLADNTLWAEIRANDNSSGWVRAETLRLTDYLVVVNPVVGDRLNLRAAPSTDATSLGKFCTGATVRVIDEPSGDWIKVRVGGLEGYMMLSYLEPFTIANVFAYEDMPERVAITAPCLSSVSPSENSANVSGYQAGDTVCLLAVRADGTALVKRHGDGLSGMGWVKAERLDPMPSFSAGGFTQKSNLMIVVNPDPTDRLNLREEPDANSHSVGKYYTGTVVTVDSESTPDGWAYVNIGSEYGYMDKKYLIPYTAADAARYAAALPAVTVSNTGGTGVNLRSSPDSGRSVIRLAKNGSSFLALGITANGFLCLKDGEQIVYALSTMLSPSITFDKGGSSSGRGKTSDINRMIVCNPDSSDRLNLRESADSRSASLGKYYTGAVVSVTKTADVEWVMASIGTESGFMNTKYLVPYTEEAARNGSTMLPKARVSNVGGTGLNLRSYAAMGSKVLKIIPNGESLTVLGVTANGWACVQTGDTIGYVDADKLSPAVTFEK